MLSYLLFKTNDEDQEVILDSTLNLYLLEMVNLRKLIIRDEARVPRHQMTDAEWELIADIFPEPAATDRPPRDPRELLNAAIAGLFIWNAIPARRAGQLSAATE